MKKRKMIMIISILFMAIGFASVSAVLYLNGQIGIVGNTGDFDVYFSRVFENDVENNSLIQDKTHITFTTELHEIGEEYKLKYEVTNSSTHYDANIMMNCVGSNDYLRVSNDFDLTEVLPARKKREGILTLSMIKSPLEEISIEIICEITGNAVEREKINASEISGEYYTESILNGTDPVLKDELIPITITNDGTVTYANISKKWYSYENKEWANAVILKDGITHHVGDIIPEEDIESYFVWVPKYKYQLFDMGVYTDYINNNPPEAPKEIQIEFTLNETENTNTSCVSPKVAGESGTCEVGKWMTHPAFQNFDVTGLWVGKFENGYNNGIIVKPNVSSWGNTSVATFFKTSYNYKRELDSHMMKNTEWGAVAYLSNSKYGINTEVRINNNQNYLTGYAANTKNAANSATDNQPYNTPTGYLASTTGNITGIYDMSGCSGEYMAAYSGTGSGGLTNEELTTYSKYFDVYPSSKSNTAYDKRILGDATGEMGAFYNGYRNSWYNDYSYFVNYNYTWFYRGGLYANKEKAGQFYFSSWPGGANYRYMGSRLVLAVN